MLRLHVFLIALLVLLVLTPSRPALAESPPKATIVVAVDPSAGLDAVALRKAIGEELRMDAVAPEDARAGTALGTISVAADRVTKKLVVRYRAQAAPLTREVPLPDDSTAAMRAAVVLAGNLARDEASELADDLRKRAAKPSVPTKAPGAPPDDSSLDVARLDRTLAYQAQQARTARLAVGSSLLGLGAASLGSSIYVGARGGRDAGVTLGAIGIPFTVFGIYALASTSELESLWIMRQNGEHPDAVEARWAKLAESEHKNRRNASVLALVVGAAALTYGTIQTVYAASATSPSDYAKASGPVSLLGGAIYVLVGVYGLATDGPTESSLRLYERGIGRAIAPEALASRFRLAIVPGGAVAGFGGSF